jgi:ABC-2 type transport system ATP-binding protein
MPTSGNVFVKDFNIYQNPVEIKKLIGYLPESAPLYPDMIVYDYLNFVADIRELVGNRKETRIRELAALCGLHEVMHKPIHELSKGYKQRVGLAHAMMSDPEILVLDEPTSGLDPNQIVEIRDIIKKIGREKTVILSTHILSEAEATCDRIVIINKGRIVADGSTETLKRETGKDYAINVSIAEDNFERISSALKSIQGVREIIKTGTGDGITDFYVTCTADRDLRADIYSVIRDNGWTLLEFHRETKTLEKIFRDLTKGNE